MTTRITSYIRQNFGEEVLNEVKAGKRTITVNGVVLDGTAANFRDKRVTETSRIEISDNTSSYEVVVTENAINHANHEESKTEISEPIITPEVTPIEAVETTITIPSGVRVKRHYQALRERKPAPAGAIIHKSKSGKKFYLKVIGEERYL